MSLFLRLLSTAFFRSFFANLTAYPPSLFYLLLTPFPDSLRPFLPVTVLTDVLKQFLAITLSPPLIFIYESFDASSAQ